jgi:hypothetical protein
MGKLNSKYVEGRYRIYGLAFECFNEQAVIRATFILKKLCYKMCTFSWVDLYLKCAINRFVLKNLRYKIFHGKVLLRNMECNTTTHTHTDRQDSAVDIVTVYWLSGRGAVVGLPVRARYFTSPRVQTGSGAHPAYYPMGALGSFHAGKATGAWSQTTHLQLVPRLRIRGCIHPFPHKSSWRNYY